MKKILIAFIIFVTALFSLSSCSSGVSQQEYNKVNDDLKAAQSQLNTLQSKLTEAEKLVGQVEQLNRQIGTATTELSSLKARFDDLNKQKAAIESELAALKASSAGAPNVAELIKQKDTLATELAALQTKYTELEGKYQEAIKEPAPITEKDLEIALFDLINEERTNAGVKKLVWNESVYSDAIANSRKMATYQRLEYPIQGAYQQVYRAAGHTTAQQMAEAVLTVWKGTEYYKERFLTAILDYGIIGVYQSAGIYNITYFADRYK